MTCVSPSRWWSILYVTDYFNDQLHRVEDGGVTPLLTDTHHFWGVDLAASGDLYAVDDNTWEMYRIDADDLAAGSITDADMADLGEVAGGCGLAFFADANSFYVSDCGGVTKSSLTPVSTVPDDSDDDSDDDSGDGGSVPPKNEVTPEPVPDVVTNPEPDVTTSPKPDATPSPSPSPAPAPVAEETTVRAEVTRTSLAPGGTQTITGSGFLPGERVHGVLHSTPVDLGWATADANGDVAFTVTLPDDFELGAHSVTMEARPAAGSPSSTSPWGSRRTGPRRPRRPGPKAWPTPVPASPCR